ncbi:hypothetical protein D3C80_1948200 [compost metagenome]
MVWPRRSLSFCATMRAAVSVGPPGGKATTIFTSLLGQAGSAAKLAPVARVSTLAAPAVSRWRRLREACGLDITCLR